MSIVTTRRATLAMTAAALGAAGGLGKPALAQRGAKTRLRLSTTFTEQDLRADAYKTLVQAVSSDFAIEPYFNNSLFRQGTELVAMQRGNLEMCNLAPFDIAKQLPAWSLMTSAYLFRDVDHLNKVFRSEAGQDMIKMARDKLGIEIITPVYFGTRQVNLKPTKQIRTPADLAGMKLRMPPGEFWQFLGEAIGASPTPVAYAEVYTALQTGAIDGQDNPLLASQLMKFNEVTSQFVMTNHVIAYDCMAVTSKVWNAMTPEQQSLLRREAEKAMGDYTIKYAAEEQKAAEAFKAQGLKVYTPDLDAFRAFAQRKYLSSSYAVDWPAGMLERINAVT